MITPPSSGLSIWIENVEGRRRRRSNPVVGHVVNAEGVFQALREQSGMSTPIRATLWIQAVAITPSPSRSSRRTGVSQSGHDPLMPSAAKQVAVFTTMLADKSLTATWTLVHRVSHQRFAALECLAHTRQIGCRHVMTESITALLASARAVSCACRGSWTAAQ